MQVTVPQAASLILTCLVACMFTAAAGAATYHVATNGDDGDAGDAAHPWRTIQKAASTATAGDTVLIHGGIYSERVVPTNSGTAGSPITFAAMPGEMVVIDGSSITLPEWGGLVNLFQLSHVVLEGLAVRYAGPNTENAGILVDECDHIVIRDCTTYDTSSSGIGVWNSSEVEILDNRIELACNDGGEECLTIASTDGFVVRGNEVLNGGPGSQGGEGIDLKDGAANGLVEHNHVHHVNRIGIYVDSWDAHTHDIVVRNNLVHDIQASGMAVAAEAGGLLQDIWVYNNLVFGSRYTGITVAGWGEPGALHPIDRVWILHNTFHDNGDTWGGGILFENPAATNITVRHNIVSENLSFQIADEGCGAGQVVDRNLVDGSQTAPAAIWGTDPVTGDPGFADASTGDYHILLGSAAIDAATGIDAVAMDHDRGHRPIGIASDLGAFEFGHVFSDGFEFGSTVRWSATTSP